MKTYLRILAYARPLRRYLPQYILFSLLGIIFGLINFTLLKPLFDVLFGQVNDTDIDHYRQLPDFSLSIDYFTHLFNHYFLQITETHGKVGSLFFVCLVIVVSVFLSNLFVYLSSITLAEIRAKVIRSLRMDIFGHVSELHLGFFSDERKGDLMSRITNDVQEVENSIVSSLKVVFKEPATIIIYFIALFTMSFQLTLFTLVLLPISGTIISEITKRLKKKARQSQESLGRLVNILDETLSGMRVIKAFNARNYVVGKFDEEVNKYANINISMAHKNELASPLSQFMGVSVVAGILLYGGTLVLNNDSALDASEFFVYIVIFSQILNPAKAISSAFSTIQRGLASGERIFSVVDTQPAIADKADAKTLTTFNDSITFENVQFKYQDETVLKDINLTIPKGKTVALVGPSGGGKSTLADLVPRFYDPSEGNVLLDGVSLQDYTTDSIRSKMGIVTQESILFNDTIFNNIAFGIPDANTEKVEQAAKIANAHDFIMESPLGYQTEIGDRGARLSGGQRQRLSIARAVLKNPDILILDEATSALDSESERLVQDALNKLMQNRTSLVIAHRLSTIQHADMIVVLKQGEIVETGKHTELLRQNGLYKKLNTMQAL